ncbi:hypothetical protein BC829DRAFT_378173 [Chytridium lagenaria]|nr:hypothetical protein BC829DRAFT_378173 [Chytridium lagenaria]
MSVAIDSTIGDALRIMSLKRVMAVAVHSFESAYTPETDEMIQESHHEGIVNIADILRYLSLIASSTSAASPTLSSITSEILLTIADSPIKSLLDANVTIASSSTPFQDSSSSPLPTMYSQPFDITPVTSSGHHPPPRRALDGDASLLELLEVFRPPLPFPNVVSPSPTPRVQPPTPVTPPQNASHLHSQTVTAVDYAHQDVPSMLHSNASMILLFHAQRDSFPHHRCFSPPCQRNV